ncbi:MAG: hypothetical protein BAJALOKI2v1_30086 [Promethearchaeota archaeon]|nr:MAG: hypothetical protein BAJALOKI2v1_30086 [Candidatus Lokiarchaeota archaeon]
MIEGEYTLLSYYRAKYFEKTPKEHIPPFIGCFLSDKDGRILIKFESFRDATQYFLKKSIENQLTRDNFDEEIIPMFLCALEGYTSNLNLEEIVEINLAGNKIGMYIHFFENFNLTMIMSPAVEICEYKGVIIDYFSNLIEDYENELKKRSNNNFNDIIDILTELEKDGSAWINQMNQEYQQ